MGLALGEIAVSASIYTKLLEATRSSDESLLAKIMSRLGGISVCPINTFAYVSSIICEKL